MNILILIMFAFVVGIIVKKAFLSSSKKKTSKKEGKKKNEKVLTTEDFLKSEYSVSYNRFAETSYLNGPHERQVFSSPKVVEDAVSKVIREGVTIESVTFGNLKEHEKISWLVKLKKEDYILYLVVTKWNWIVPEASFSFVPHEAGFEFYANYGTEIERYSTGGNWNEVKVKKSFAAYLFDGEKVVTRGYRVETRIEHSGCGGASSSYVGSEYVSL